MENVRTKPVLCAPCNGKGLITPGNTCPICDGTGGFPRLQVHLKILSLRDVESCDGPCFRRMAVLSIEQAGPISLVRVVTDSGVMAAAVVDADRLAAAPTAPFDEAVSWS